MTKEEFEADIKKLEHLQNLHDFYLSIRERCLDNPEIIEQVIILFAKTGFDIADTTLIFRPEVKKVYNKMYEEMSKRDELK